MPHLLSKLQQNRLKRALPRLFAALAALFLVVGVIGVIYIQTPLKADSQDTRSDASIAGGTVFIRSPQDGQTAAFVADTERVLQFEIKTQAERISRVQLVFNIVTRVFEPPLLKVPSTSQLQITSQELERTTDGYLVSTVLEAKGSGSFIAADWEPLVELFYTPVRGGDITVIFDPETSTAVSISTGEDKLKHVENVTYKVAGGPASPTAPAGVGGPVVELCNIPCSSNRECGLNQRCFDTGTEKRCRAVANVSSTSCAAVDANAGQNRTCNEGCADSSECAAGFSCWYNLCRNSTNVESVSCAAQSAAQNQATAAACNRSCSSNDDCANNLRCYDSQCRLATNPSSTSCSSVSAPTVSSLYPTKGGIISNTPEVPDEPPAEIEQPAQSPIPTPPASVAPIPSEMPQDSPRVISPDRTALDDFVELVEDFDIRAFIPGMSGTLTPEQQAVAAQLLPFIALGIGVLFVVIALVYFLRSFLAKRSEAQMISAVPSTNNPTNTSSASTATQSSTQQTAQQATAPTKPLPPLPTSPIPRTHTAHGLQPTAAPPSRPPQKEVAPFAPTTTTEPLQAAKPTTASPMLDRLKAKGVAPPGK